MQKLSNDTQGCCLCYGNSKNSLPLTHAKEVWVSVQNNYTTAMSNEVEKQVGSHGVTAIQQSKYGSADALQSLQWGWQVGGCTSCSDSFCSRSTPRLSSWRCFLITPVSRDTSRCRTSRTSSTPEPTAACTPPWRHAMLYAGACSGHSCGTCFWPVCVQDRLFDQV